MPTITSAASGNWSAGATWVGGVAPTSADDVIIAKNTIVTLDALTCAARTIALALGTTGTDNGGELTCSKAVNTRITTQIGISAPHATGNGGTWSSFMNFDLSAHPDISCEFVLNVLNNTTTAAAINCSGNYVFKGFPKKRWTTITTTLNTAETAVTVVDATGWKDGDRLVFATTSAYNATPRTDDVLLTSRSGNNLTIPAVTWPHAIGCPVGNFTSNLIIRPNLAGQNGNLHCNNTTGFNSTSQSIDCFVDDVEFRGGNGAANQSQSLYLNGGGPRLVSASRNAFYDFRSQAQGIRALAKPCTRDGSVFYTTASQNVQGGQDVSADTNSGPDTNYAVFRASYGVSILFQGQHQIGHKVSGLTQIQGPLSGLSSNLVRADTRIVDCDIWSSRAAIANGCSTTLQNVRFGSEVFPGCNNDSNIHNLTGITTAIDTMFPAANALTGMGSRLVGSQIKIVNKNGDPAIQEVYSDQSLTVAAMQRDTSLAASGRSTSAILMTFSGPTAISQSFEVLTRAGQTIQILCLVRKSGSPAYGAATLPSITVSGLGITPVVVSMSAGTPADTWETLSISATNTASSDGNLTVTLSGQSATAGARAWFSGIPISPFISRCRHYGYNFDESSPTRTVNPVTVATESVAAAYTGVTINTVTPSLTIGAGTANTFQKVYDHIQAWACENVGLPVLMTSTDGNNFALPTTCRLSWPGMGADGTLIGGRLLLAAAGTHTYKLSGTVVEFQTAGTYNMGETQFSGGVEFINTSGGAVTVSIPSGFTPTNTGPNITLSAPVLTTTIAAQVSLAGAEVRVYDLDNSPAGSLGSELAGVESCPVSTFSFTTAAGNSIWVQILLAGYKEYGQQLTAPSASTTFTLVLATETDA